MTEDDNRHDKAIPYGIPQFLNSTWELYGGKPTDPAEQIRIGTEYIKQRYGNGGPDWSHDFGWYSA